MQRCADPFRIADSERAAAQAVALGQEPATRAIVNGMVYAVQSGEVLPAHVAFAGRLIAYVGQETFWRGPRTEVVDAQGAWVVPGFIEPHAHPWVGYNPDSLARAFLVRGITTAVGDLLDLQSRVPESSWNSLLEQWEAIPFTWLWGVRLRSQDHTAITMSSATIRRLLARPRTIQFAEIPDWPALLSETALAAAVAAGLHSGYRVDGHTAGARGRRLQALVSAGLTSCHEPIRAEEALERLRSGLWVMLRHSSVRPDLGAWLELWQNWGATINWSRCLVTHDGANPAWVQERGGVDGIVRDLVAGGMTDKVAVALATINPATYFRVDERIGLVAPGRLADVQVRRDWSGPPDWVFKAGVPVAAGGTLLAPWPSPRWAMTGTVAQLGLDGPWATAGFYQPVNQAWPCGRFESTVIVRPAGWLGPGAVPSQSVVWAILLARDGRRAAGMWLDHFLYGQVGLATTFVESGGLLVIGRDPVAMANAARAVLEVGGGLAIADKHQVRALVTLDLGGRMASAPLETVAAQVKRAEDEARAAGYSFGDLLYSLDFLTADFLPGWRLLEAGVYDVQRRTLVARGWSLPR